MRIAVTAGYAQSLHAITLIHQVAAQGHDVVLALEVKVLNVARLRFFLRQLGWAKLWAKLHARLGAGQAAEVVPMLEYLHTHQIRSRTVAAASRHVGARHVKVADLNTPRALAALRAARVDLVVYAGGGILRRAFIHTPPLGVLNAHGGPLPAFRGMSVAEWALLHGVRPEVSVHYIDEGIDTGPVVLHRPIPRDAWSSVPHLRGVAARVSVEALLEAVERSAEGRIEAQPQRLNDGRQFFVMAEPLLEVLERWLAHDRTPVVGADGFAFHGRPPMAACRPREGHGGHETLYARDAGTNAT